MADANSRTKNTLLNTIGGFAVKIATILMAFITRTIFIKTLGIQYAGVSGVFTDILVVLSFAEMGIGAAIAYALYKPIADDDEAAIARFMNAYRKIYTAIAGVILGLGLCLIPLLGYIIKDVPDIIEDIRLIYILYVLNTASSYLLIYKTAFLTAAQKDYLVSKVKIVISLLKAAAECVCLLIFRNFIVYLIIGIAFQLLQNLIVARVAEREYPILKKKNRQPLEKKEKTKLIADIRALFLYKVSGTVLNGTDSLVISSFIGTPAVGVLGNYNLITNQIYSLVMQIFSATSASVGNLAATSSPEHQETVFNKMLFLCFWIYCFCATALWTLLTPFMLVWQGEEYLFSGAMVALLITDFWMKGMLSPISQFRTSNGLFTQGKYRPLIMAIINIAVSIFLVKLIGITGVIIGTIVSRLTTQLWYDPYLIYKRVFRKSVLGYYLKYVVYIAVTVGCCLLSSFLLNCLPIENLYLKVLIGFGFALVIPNAAIVLLYFRTTEFRGIVKLVSNVIKRKV
ncbi:MAG: hypothetical protein IJJ99_02515 [Oscillospiraceae bacterium]|nr:hypothetical protein [Oscillospiraceae bacterium]